MKRLLPFLLPLLLFSCKKDKTPDTLIGKWQLIEVYQGSASTGCLCWSSIPAANADELEFFISGKYKLTKSLLSSSLLQWIFSNVINNIKQTAGIKIFGFIEVFFSEEYFLNINF